MADVIVGPFTSGVETHTDPDAQATVTDFLDQTEHLPSDLARSLTLIEKLDTYCANTTEGLHDLLKIYGTLDQTSDKTVVALDAQGKRSTLSYNLDLILHRRAASYAEASRLSAELERHQNRLTSITAKLHALPKPPSREPTPQPTQSSPQATRAQPGRVAEGRGGGGESPQRIKSRLDNGRFSGHSARSGGIPRPRHRRVIVPGEVLPPPNPDSPTPSEYSDYESASPPRMPTPRPDGSRNRSHKSSKNPKTPKHKSSSPNLPRKDRPPRPAGQMGTNVHSAVAGISTSNALMMLTPPPISPIPGTVHAPWMRLTEYEMARLRKRMKKNAIWAPSDTMIRRELFEAGRGPDNYHKAKLEAEMKGEEFIDCDDLQNKDKSSDLVPGEIRLDVKTKIFNKGMSLNVQKKEKKAAQQRELAAQAKLEAEQAAQNLSNLSTNFKTLFDRPEKSSPASKSKSAARPQKKRKRDTSLATEDSQIHAQLQSEIVVTPTAPKPPSKKRKPAQASASKDKATTPVPPPPPPTAPVPAAITTTTTTIPLAAPAPSPVKASTPGPQSTSPASRKTTTRAGTASKDQSATAEPTTASTSKPPSRPSSRRASAGPPPEPLNREHLRRKSITPAPPPHPVPTLASRRSKRPAPGPIENSQDTTSSVTISKRKSAPKKKGAASKKAASGATKKEEEEEEDVGEDDVDPNEPRYCVCGDVSYGTMIMCENPEVSSQSSNLLFIQDELKTDALAVR